MPRRRSTHRSRFTLLAVVAGLLGGGSDAGASDASDASGASSKREVVFTPDTPDRCDWFFITEASASYALSGTTDQTDRLVVTDAFGFMRNIGGHHAAGWSMDFLLTEGDVKYAPTLRYRRWFQHRKSLELSLGYVPGETPGLFGPIASARFSPTPIFHFEVGAHRVREVMYTYTYAESSYTYRLQERKPLRITAGVGFGGVPGIVIWGAQLVVISVLVAAYAASVQ